MVPLFWAQYELLSTVIETEMACTSRAVSSTGIIRSRIMVIDCLMKRSRTRVPLSMVASRK